MAKLIAKSPAQGLVPVSHGTMTLGEAMPEAITSIMPLAGQEKTVGAVLKKRKLGWPAPGQSLTAGDARILWSGRGQAFLLGSAPGELNGAAVTDQSDGWAVLVLEGAQARDALARLTPLDLRPGTFAVDATARSLLGHMACSVTRIAEDTYQLMVFRSMAATAVHELDRAMESVAAQG